MKDQQGREYAKLSQLKEGDTIQVDGGFDCMESGSKLPVRRDARDLFVLCAEGEHHLSGWADDGENCVGIYRAK